MSSQKLEDDDVYEGGGELPSKGEPIDPTAFGDATNVVKLARRSPDNDVEMEVLPAGVTLDTELANAHRLQRLSGGELLYVCDVGWHVWQGSHYCKSRGGAVRCGHRVTCWLQRHGRMLKLLAMDKRGDERKQLEELGDAYEAWAKRSQAARSIASMLEIAEDLEGFSCAADALDLNPMLFACMNGTVDLATGMLREARAADRISKCSPVIYDPEAQCPIWLAFLKRIFVEDDLIGFVQRACGYSLTGSTREQCLLVLHGAGANGKSVFLETMRFIVGDYGRATPMTTLMDSQKSEHRNDLARLSGARFVTASESAEGKSFDEELVKRVTGGDMMSARFLRKEFFDFKPVLKLWIATNHKPEVRGVDHGIWRRLMLIPFLVTIALDDQDPNLVEKLKGEAAGILAWCVRGCLAWQEHGGLKAPPAVSSATQEWRDEANQVAQFIEECCVTGTGEHFKVRSAYLYAAYRKWAQASEQKLLSQKAFGTRLDALGYVAERTNVARMRTGLSVPTPTDDRFGDEADADR